MKIPIFKDRTLSRDVKRELRPEKAFITRGRERFLAAFDASPLAASAGVRGSGTESAFHPRMALFAKLAIGIVAVLCVATGFSVYADTANVPVTSPLYPWKRLGENVQLAFAASAEQKAQLQATFAIRRAEELQTLAAVHPSSTMIPQLTKDLNGDISSSLSAVIPGAFGAPGVGNGHERGSSRGVRQNSGGGAGSGAAGSSSPLIAGTTTPEGVASTSIPASGLSREKNYVGGPLGVYCAAFNASASGVLIGHLEENLATHPGAFAEFNRICGEQADGVATTTVSQEQQPLPQTLFQQDGNSARRKGGSGGPAGDH